VAREHSIRFCWRSGIPDLLRLFCPNVYRIMHFNGQQYLTIIRQMAALVSVLYPLASTLVGTATADASLLVLVSM